VQGIVREHYDFVWRSLRRLGVAASYADDAAQQVFCVCAKRIDEIAIGKEKTFAFGVVLRVAQSARRAQVEPAEVSDDDIRVRMPDPSASPEDLLDEQRARAVLDAILEEMPLDLRTVFLLYEIEEITMAEIATILTIPSGTIASRLRRARDVFQRISQRVRAERAAMEKP
jgi:RNA polymerase sigma-70 factor, ECF subfamily